MSLGLSEKELKECFDTEFNKIMGRREKAETPKIIADLVCRGMDSEVANMIAMLENRYEASIQAHLRTIAMNNARIETQLKDMTP